MIELLKSYSVSFLSMVNNKVELLYISEEYLRIRLTRITGGLDVLFLKIHYTRILVKKNHYTAHHKLMFLIFLCEVQYKDLDAIKILFPENFSESILLIYNNSRKTISIMYFF